MIVRLRDVLRQIVPRWLKDRANKSVGFRILWALVAPLDALLDMAFAAFWAMLGLGTPTALPYIQRSRGILRNQGESQADYAKRVRTWLDVWPNAGSAELVAVSINQYLETHPVVKIIQRGDVVSGAVQPSAWIIVASDGTVTTTSAVWNWDFVSHPARSDPDNPFWSDEWIVVQPSQWAVRPGTLADLGGGDDGYALGHMATRQEVGELLGLIAQWKAAHSCVRAIIFTTDTTLFNPSDQSTCPNGTWGAWGIDVAGAYGPSARNTTTCRYWEPR